MREEIIETFSPEETFDIGVRLGQEAKAGEVITLYADLGCGKTVLAQGIAKGLGIDEYVNSPTFTIVQIYEGGRLPFYHFDVYRIEDPEEMQEVGFDDYIFGQGVCMIEWAELIEDILPDHARRITIEKDPAKGENYRMIKINAD